MVDDYVNKFIDRLRSLYYGKKFPQWFLAQKLEVSQGAINQWVRKLRKPGKKYAYYCFELLKKIDVYEYEKIISAFIDKLSNFMKANNFNRKQVAKVLGISRTSVIGWLDRKVLPLKSMDSVSSKIDTLEKQKAESSKAN